MNAHLTRTHSPLPAAGESTMNLAELRDQILGPRQPSEDLETYQNATARVPAQLSCQPVRDRPFAGKAAVVSSDCDDAA